jgi:hypothetical protein
MTSKTKTAKSAETSSEAAELAGTALPEPVPEQKRGVTLTARFGEDGDPRRQAALRVWDIRKGLAGYAELLGLIRQAYDARDWHALGYGNWEGYVAGEYGAQLGRVRREDLPEVVRELAPTMSVRAIAPVVGASKSTVARLAAAAEPTVPGGTVEPGPGEAAQGPTVPGGTVAAPRKKTGLDGRARPARQAAPKASRPPKPEPPLPWAPGGYAWEALSQAQRYVAGEPGGGEAEAVYDELAATLGKLGDGEREQLARLLRGLAEAAAGMLAQLAS